MNYVIAFILLAAVGASKATKEAPATSLCVSNTGPATDGEYVQVPVAEGSYITEQYSRGALSLFRTNTGYVEAPQNLVPPPRLLLSFPGPGWCMPAGAQCRGALFRCMCVLLRPTQAPVLAHPHHLYTVDVDPRVVSNRAPPL